MVENFIRRPVLSLVISLLLVLLGLLALQQIPITQFPDIVPPSVVVTAKYTGANANVVANAVTIPIERAINGVAGMTSINSVSTNNGIALIQVSFAVGTDPDQAAVNVQNRVTTVLDELPEEVIKAGVTTEKEVNSMLLYLNITSTDESTDESFIFNFADINLLQELKRIDGVGFAEIMGSREYAMRVWLKPDKMLAYQVSANEVVEVLKKQNIEAAPGKIGEASGKTNTSLQYVLKYTGKFNKPEQYEAIVIRAEDDGSLLRLRDIADIEFGSFTYGMSSKTNGKPSASIMLKQRPGSNAAEVIKNVKNKMAELKASSFPPGMDYNFAYDVSRFLDASIKEVIKTLIEAFILVFLVVFIFLQDWRATLISALAVPVALVSTFAFMHMLGFSVNLLTLFALVLAIGIVVDNAIVVVEAVHVKMHDLNLPPLQATIEAMKEISGAILAITLVMSAVFIPVAFLSGPVGVFYRQFSLTLAISIVISGINALTLTPALCALWLKPVHHSRQTIIGKFFHKFNNKYDTVENKYASLVGKIAGKTKITLTLLVVFFGLTYLSNSVLPTGFIPTEDQGMLYINVVSPPGATVERSEKILAQVEQIALSHPAVENTTTLAGFSLLTETAGSSYGMGMINLKAWKDREASVDDVIKFMYERTNFIKGAKIEYFPPPTVPGFGNASGFEFRLLDKTKGNDLSKMAAVSDSLAASLTAHKAIEGAFSSFDPSFPQYLVHVNQELAASKGINIENALSNLQILIGSEYATNFIRFSNMYKVMVQALPEFRKNPEDILKLYVKNDAGEMVSFASFISLERVFGPEQLTRYNLYNAAMFNGDAAKGFTSGDAINGIKEVSKRVLPRGFDIAFSGITREQELAGNQVIFIFLLVLVFVYLLLAGQYESFSLPFAVLLSLAPGVFGSFFFLYITGLENNIYAQVALVMLVGLLGKNAILVVEFALQQQKTGISTLEAAKAGAKSRLRPILMTSFAFIAGLLPLCFASGAGAMGNKSIGIAAAGGMFLGTVFGLFIIPGLFYIFGKAGEKLKKRNLGQLKTEHYE